ncbi:MAG: hypothetical protein ACTHKS_17185 [Gaiellaceae bacterium]
MFQLRTATTLAVLAVVVAVVAGSARGVTHPLTVTSSLDGKKVLPQMTRWIARPNVAPAEVTRVDFLIDGKLRWTEHFAPYNYGSDDEKGHLGYLFTSWLTPGVHRFTSIVRATGARTATDVVTARVVPSPAPPATLAGTWTRQLTSQDAAKADPKYGTDNVPPTGRWRLVIDRVGVWELDSLGTGIVQGYSISGDTLRSYAPITTVPKKPNGDPGEIRRFGSRVDTGGGLDCDESGPFGTYRWTVTGDHLTLSVVNEPCGQRRAVYEGTWTRVG